MNKIHVLTKSIILPQVTENEIHVHVVRSFKFSQCQSMDRFQMVDNTDIRVWAFELSMAAEYLHVLQHDKSVLCQCIIVCYQIEQQHYQVLHPEILHLN